MSSECTTTSPSQVSAGPGGCLDELTSALKRASVSAGDAPLWVTMSLLCMRLMLNPEEIILTKNWGGLILAVAVMWASTSRTDQSLHSDGLAHCSSLSPARSAARASRSPWIVPHMSALAIGPLPVRSAEVGSSRCRRPSFYRVVPWSTPLDPSIHIVHMGQGDVWALPYMKW